MYKNNKKYIQYIQKIEKVVNEYNCTGLHILEEVESHFFEAMSCGKYDSYTEDERISKIISKLGDPQQLVQAIVSEQELRSAVSGFNFIKIIKAVSKNILIGSRYAISCCLYIFSLVFAFIAIAKFVYPDNTGLFIGNNEFQGFGYLLNLDKVESEILGYWIIPLAIAFCILFGLGATLILRKYIKRKSK
ncbi:MAG: hypothetical protein UD961_03975 [Bacteroidales bacterium]|nr:hypothetical protein [Bacteroidales bacterium]